MDRKTCKIAGCKNIATLKQHKNGKAIYRNLCWTHFRNGKVSGKQKYRNVSNNVPCSRCGFIPEDKCQMDRHHINNDHFDNKPENIQILCANCHRLVTKLYRINK